MKAIVFTLDAVFALIIATASISILLYFHYISPTPYAVKYSEASSILNLLSSTNISSLSNASSIAKAIVQQSLGINQTWDQQQKNSARQGYAPIGPSSALTSFIYQANATIATPVVADYGMAYFAAGNYLYAINATQGNLIWKLKIGSAAYSSIALYNNMVIYANTTNITARSSNTGSLIWTTNVPLQGTSLSSQILVYGNKIIVGNSNNILYCLYAQNGTLAWSLNIGAPAGTITVASGEIIVQTITNALDGILVENNHPIELWSLSYPSSTPLSGTTAYNNLIFYGTGSNANVTYLNGTKAMSTSAGSQVSGVSSGNGFIVYQGSTTMLALNSQLGVAWTKQMPSFLGSALTNATPVLSNNFVYSLWKNSTTGYSYLVAQNIGNGSIAWYTTMPSQYAPVKSYMALAYGRLYVVANNYVIAYGACNVQASSSVLQAASSLYYSGDGSCADALLNAVYPTYNYSLEIGSTFAPDLSIATFNGSSSSIFVGNSSSLEPYSYTWSVWIYPTAWTVNSGIITEGCTSLGCPYMIEQSNATAPYRVEFSIDGGASGYTVYAPVSLNSWQNIVATYSYGYNGILAIYVNGTLWSKVKISSPVSRVLSPMYIGYYNVSGKYFTGRMANIPLYRSALNATQVMKLYLNGVQGGPLSRSAISAWYPLAGDANDYSGNGNIGYPYQIRYTYSNYTPTTLANAYEISKAISSTLSNITTAQFNGYSSYIYVSNLNNIPQNSITIAGWIYITGFTNSNGDQEWWTSLAGANAIGLQSYPNTYPGASSSTITFFLHNATNSGYGGCSYNSNLNSLNTWYFVAEVINGTKAQLYVNGQPTTCTFTFANPGTEKNLTIGAYNPGQGPGGVMDGNEANIQVYNIPLSSKAIQMLYKEGINGPPIDMQHLVAWWPLNGNANDYSGNGYNGKETNVAFTPLSEGVVAWR